MTSPRNSWGPTLAERLFREVLAQGGADPGTLSLLRHGENITFDCPRLDLVARITRPSAPLAAVVHELACASYLSANRFPCARPADGFAQPIRTDNGYITVWERLEGRPGTIADLPEVASLLSVLHAIPVQPWMRPWNPLQKAQARLQSGAEGGCVSQSQLNFLKDRADSMQIQVDALTFEEHLCHGDAHEGNLLVLRRTAYLLDWEDASLGPREWDLADVLLSHRRFGLSQQTLENFLLKYEESHSLDHSRFELMADLKELTATLWLLQNAEVDPLARTEVVGRIAAMRGVGDGAVWKTF